MIRQATKEDKQRIYEMSARFYPTTHYKQHIEMDRETVEELIDKLTDQGLMFVADISKVVGVIGLVISPFLFNKNHGGGYEIILWVEPEYAKMGLAKDLLKTMETEARALGLSHVVMVALKTSPPQAGKLYESEGYELTELSYTKVL